MTHTPSNFDKNDIFMPLLSKIDIYKETRYYIKFNTIYLIHPI